MDGTHSIETQQIPEATKQDLVSRSEGQRIIWEGTFH